MKTKLGISVPLMGALLYLGGMVGGFVVLFLLAGYVLLRESDPWLRRSAVKAVLICVLFSALQAVINWIPSLLYMLDLLDVSISYTLQNFFSVVKMAVSLVESIVLFLLAIFALKQKSFTVPVVDGMINDHFEKE